MTADEKRQWIERFGNLLFIGVMLAMCAVSFVVGMIFQSGWRLHGGWIKP